MKRFRWQTVARSGAYLTPGRTSLPGARMASTLNFGRIVSDQELVQLAERRAREPPSVKVKVPPVRQTAPVQAKRRPTTKRPQRAAHKLVGQPQKLPAVRPEHWADDSSALLFANPAASSTSLWPGPAQLAVTGAGSTEEFRTLAAATQSQPPLTAT